MNLFPGTLWDHSATYIGVSHDNDGGYLRGAWHSLEIQLCLNMYIRPSLFNTGRVSPRGAP